jgi:predicted nucleic acid-binding protein
VTYKVWNGRDMRNIFIRNNDIRASMSRRLRIYIDTSVIGGYLDKEFKDASQKLINRFKKGEFQAVISDITKLELKQAPAKVQAILKKIPEKNIEHVELTKDATELTKIYISEGVLTKSKIVDAQHIAIATINKVDVIVSWNFKHIVNIDKIRGFNAVNLKMGYSIIDIRSPWEVISYEE